ncbi:hypothetical protein [Streptomyces otsuchiensis]|uniref:hypothetical protein n=1 Tax=Streptomyces otsuchiensis TaxID=2681388 RepID=UPI001D130B18|nr:hypothetical protein [Streptomyces otsuchiensis]
MHATVARLVAGREHVGRAAWSELWDDLAAGRLERGDALALLTSLSGVLPGPRTLGAFLDSLDERRPSPRAAVWPGTANIVGTGGGPPTVNVSTAAALVAAAAGTPVVKSGSRAHTSSMGSVNLLERLGVPLTSSHERTAEQLERHGVAFTGPYVYPPQLVRLAMLVAPTSMKLFGRFLNAVGPFLAELPVTAQLTGVSSAVPLEPLLGLAERAGTRSVWLNANAAGADELLPFTENILHRAGGDATVLHAGRVADPAGTLADLAPPGEPGEAVDRFREVLAGAAGPVVTETVALNAAAVAVAAGRHSEWSHAMAEAREVLREGAALSLLARVTAGRKAEVRVG